MNRLWLIALLVLAAGRGLAADELFQSPVSLPAPDPAFSAVTTRLRAARVVRAEFQQVKTIKALTRPLKSAGNFIFAADQGLLWETKTPFPSVTILLPDAILLQNDDGSFRRVPASEQAMIRSFADLFLATFAGDTDKLRSHFDLYFQGNDQAWRLGLKPRDKTIRQAIDQIVLTGTVQVEQVQIRESNGDQTTITLAQVSSTPATLTPAEGARFALP